MSDIIQLTWSILTFYWWITLPGFLILAFLAGYAEYTMEQYLSGLKWSLLEIKLPPDVQKSPRIAEHIFDALHSIYISPVKPKKRFFEGKVPDWFSFEIVSNGGDIRFLIRTLEGYRNLVESLFFSQYPDAEIKVAKEDYIDLLPVHLPNADYELFGTELVFNKEDVYPLKTYMEFEDEGGKDEFKRTDPLTPLLEVMSALEPGEHIWLQYLVRPVGGGWVDKGKVVIDKIIGRKPKDAGASGFAKVLGSIDSAIWPGPAVKEEKKEEREPTVQNLTPRQKTILEAVENKMSKIGFEAGPRFIYIAKKDKFNRSRTANVTGMFKQLYANDMNSFRPNKNTITFSDGYFEFLLPKGRGLFAADIELKRKINLYRNYRARSFVKKPVILNTEELATLYHLPGLIAQVPLLPRVETVKGQPPAVLPTR